MKSIETYKNRFLDELETIDRYVQYMEQNFYLQYKKLEVANELVKKFDLFTECQEQRKSNQIILKEVQEKIKKALVECEDKINKSKRIEIPEWANDLRILNDEYGLTEYLNPVYCDNDSDYIEYLNTVDPLELKLKIDKLDEKNNYAEFHSEDYKYLIEYMKIIHNNETINDLENTYDELINFLTLYKIFDSENPINIYRQSFILLMTAFDATIYDISKELFINNFFSCVEKLDNKGKISYSDIAKKGSFESMALDIVEDSLSKIYLHKLLFIIRDSIEHFFVFEGKDIFVDIIEMVKRRNIHVHNKGIVDQQYFESDIKHNIYNLVINEYATIDDDYYIKAYDYLKLMMINIS
ncbi:hypothetical protein [Clostridium formicaceticum]|uniref:Uncharacterized protein n=2 Tax=Clostridium formicaceticum TaxID=1497 RepID=A0AAC9RKA8_9CLOT|nr:hypothetical protein [Clostridium formicaceticum]AOY76704.1 hypothetical protein BJL90_13000 [Clostridium formicaceticum]ARE87137.1 hypothetical protein CLFO_15230 [Clostridium formicaceticum]